RTPLPSGGEEVGTAIFIIEDNKNPYILTANHVAKSCTNSTLVVISDAASKGQSFPLPFFNPSLAWKHHPIADLSVLPVVPDKTLVPHLSGRFFPTSQLEFATSPPSRDAYLTAVGFPHGLGAVGHFSPFTFRSHATSGLITLARFDTKTPCDFFVLEHPSVGGYSGGPVFDLGYIVVGAMTTSTGPTRCLGIMHGTIADSTGGKIAAVTPCSYVMDLL
ncbi:MAG TPA: serine protease, partial [Candidatus Polarisedimenticolia bacterium]|nr:serine protease [Candidatus Polarisedimenticolia bacterium]